MENSIERLRNKLSPLFTLISIMNDVDVIHKLDMDEKIIKIIEQNLKRCGELLPEIREHLDEAGKLNNNDYDYIINSLNQTWNSAHYRISNEKNLGDIERRELEMNKEISKSIMRKLGAI